MVNRTVVGGNQIPILRHTFQFGWLNYYSFRLKHVSLSIDMARQVVTGNDSTGAFLKKIKPTVSISIANEQNYYEFKPISFLFPGK